MGVSGAGGVRRIYLPVGARELQALADERELPARGEVGFTVTPALRDEAGSGDDEEELEYLAIQQAADTAAGHGQRVIAAADLDGTDIGEAGAGPQSAAISVLSPVPLRRVASLHVLDADGPQEGEWELSWYDVTELPAVQDLLAD